MDRDRAGQSGDIEGLSPIAEAGPESVEEFAATDQALEAETVAGVETQQTILKGRYIRTKSTDDRMTVDRRKGPNVINSR